MLLIASTLVSLKDVMPELSVGREASYRPP
jgi:hypothetical protein